MRLSVGPGINVPSTFVLLRSNDVKAGRRAHVVWRKKSQIAAKFIKCAPCAFRRASELELDGSRSDSGVRGYRILPDVRRM